MPVTSTAPAPTPPLPLAPPEYYPTERERSILQAHADDIVAACDATTVVEPGSGTSDKARTLLDAFAEHGRPERFVPVDVSEQTLRDAAMLSRRYPASRSRPSSATSPSTSGACPGAAAGSSPSSAAPSATSTSRSAPPSSARCTTASRPATGSCSAPTSSRAPTGSSPPTTTAAG
ncbi:hypothetical protein FHW15_001508 [Terracoccus luteus]|nr:hypothetical protein [Terracoccus luteus]